MSERAEKRRLAKAQAKEEARKAKEPKLEYLADVVWAQTEAGHTPLFNWKGETVLQGATRPFPAFFEGERRAVAQAIMIMICQELFGEAPLDEIMLGGQPKLIDNPRFDKLPYAKEIPPEKEGDPPTWEMSDGSPMPRPD